MSDVVRNTIKQNLLINNNDLMKEFNHEKNNNENILNLKLGSHKKVWWRCRKCGYEWMAEINNRNKGRGCPKCAKKNRTITTNSKLIKEKGSLLSVNPSLASEWDYEKNGNLKPKDFLPNSNKKVWWKCSKCGYEWQASICNRNKGRGCSICSNKKVLKGYNDLATTNPELLKEWDYEKNDKLGIKPNEVTKGSKKKVWWKCSNNHNCFLPVKVRCSNTHIPCPFCSGKIPMKGYNDLATTNPELLKEWDYEKNDKLGIKPDEVTKGSKKKVWWKCSKCGYEWQAIIDSRVRGSGCSNYRKHL